MIPHHHHHLLRGVPLFLILVLLSLSSSPSYGAAPIPGFRPPAVPLVVNDPYLSIWSFADNLTDIQTTLWDGANKNLTGLIRVDNVVYRWMGYDTLTSPQDFPPVQQISVTVTPTRTIYIFEVGTDLQLTVTFFTPILPTSHDLMSRPVTYITMSVLSTNTHHVDLYFSASAELAVQSVNESVSWSRQQSPGGLNTMRTGTVAQQYCALAGDAVGINWGYLYVAAPSSDAQMAQCVGPQADVRAAFVKTGTVPNDTKSSPGPVTPSYPVLAVSWGMTVTPGNTIEKTLIIAYDDVYSMNYFGLMMKAYWTQLYPNILALMDKAWSDYPSLLLEATQFDVEFFEKMTTAGGDKYSTLTALSFRQVMGGTKLVWNSQNSSIWFFMKEISSDGDVSTMDVIFPASPFFLYYDATLLQYLLLPILEYSMNHTNVLYNLPWCPHHLGTWPISNLRPDQQENMPVEETAGMMIMLAAILQQNPDWIDFLVSNYWTLLHNWGEYLLSSLPDPENQLCTDDFEGPIPHNSNLAGKGIIGLGAWAQILALAGDFEDHEVAFYEKISAAYAAAWMQLSNPNNTNHYNQRYDKPGWSLKYNLIWQYLLHLKTFPQEVFDTELAFYRTKLTPYGVPLDNTMPSSDIDSESWVFCFDRTVTGFAELFGLLYDFADFTPQRVPLTDWYWVDQGTQRGFQARPVLGGFWMQALLQKV
eukprot:TRINITY_DN1541_c0_g1_i1.p1 TRINITY_DN1541_c0_g1~~TRINITY_DN1541_c0_g1_i1.p1  ORF type:complete len:751 (-),score=154.96 TRINITY_DN1541_c0_g1_i1:88-2193(-)